MDTQINIKEESCMKHESGADVSKDHVSDLIQLADIKQERVKDESTKMDIESELLLQKVTFNDNFEDINVEVKPLTVEEVIIKNEILDDISLDKCYDNRHFTTKSSIQIDLENKQFKCRICEYRCLTRRHLTLHIRKHTRMKPFECEICNKKYSASGSLRRHMRTHYEEKRYACVICCKRFSTNYTLQGHMNLHSGEKPFDCDICKKKFSTRSYYLDHMQQNHAVKNLVQLRKSDSIDGKMNSPIIEEVYVKSEIACELFANSVEDLPHGDPIVIGIKQEPFSIEVKPEARMMAAKREYSNYKYCFISGCKNTSIATPTKIFISVPTTEKIRIAWLKAANRDPKSISKNTHLDCCEDHFNLEEDMENYLRFTMMGGKTIIKKHVVPHLFTCQDRK